MNAVLDQVAQDSELRGALEDAFDFRILSKRKLPSWFRVKAAESFDPIAEDGSGGVFLLGRSSGRVLLVSSEGQAGIIARNIDELFQLMVSHPFWRDLLKFSGGGQLTEMKRTAPHLQREFKEVDPTLEQRRELMTRKLGLAYSTSAIDTLHASVVDGSSDVSVEAEDGTAFTGLFNRFTADQNPAWHAA